MIYHKKIIGAAFLGVSMMTPGISSAQQDGPVNDACTGGASFKCAFERTKEFSRDLEGSIASRFRGLPGRKSSDAPVVAPSPLYVDSIYHAPLRATNSSTEQAHEEAHDLDPSVLAHMEAGRWAEAEAAIALVSNNAERERLQVEYVKHLSEAHLARKALGYTNTRMTSPKTKSEAQQHIVVSEVRRGDLERARTIAEGIPDQEYRNKSLGAVSAAGTGSAWAIRSAERSASSPAAQENTVTGQFAMGVSNVATEIGKVPEVPFVQRLLTDTHAIMIPKSNPDRQHYERSKAAASEGNLEMAFREAGKIRNKSLRQKTMNRALNTFKARNQTNKLEKTFAPVTSAFKTIGKKVENRLK